eukprot:SAG22_NODE_821_length_7008_cov_8.279635_4_plen_427_part_00
MTARCRQVPRGNKSVHDLHRALTASQSSQRVIQVGVHSAALAELRPPRVVDSRTRSEVDISTVPDVPAAQVQAGFQQGILPPLAAAAAAAAAQQPQPQTHPQQFGGLPAAPPAASAFHEIETDAASAWSGYGGYERASSVSSTATMKSLRDKLRFLATSRTTTSQEVELALEETEVYDNEFEEERDVLKALQVRLVLEDVAKLGRSHLGVMEDELERYREYREYADTGVQAAWDTLNAVIADLRNPPKTDAKGMLAEIRKMSAKVLTLDCDTADVQILLRRAEAFTELAPQREALHAEFQKAVGAAKRELQAAMSRFEISKIDDALMKYELVPSKEIRKMCAELRDHRNDVRRQLEGLEDLRGRLLRVLDSDDYDALSLILKEAEPYEVLVHERDAVQNRRDAIVNAAVAEITHLVGSKVRQRSCF